MTQCVRLSKRVVASTTRRRYELKSLEQAGDLLFNSID